MHAPSESATHGTPMPRLGAKPQDHRLGDAPSGQRAAATIGEWHRKHPVQWLALRTELKKPPADLRRLEQTHAESIRFLQGSQRRIEEIEQAWPKKRLAYERKLELEGEELGRRRSFWG